MSNLIIVHPKLIYCMSTVFENKKIHPIIIYYIISTY